MTTGAEFFVLIIGRKKLTPLESSSATAENGTWQQCVRPPFLDDSPVRQEVPLAILDSPIGPDVSRFEILVVKTTGLKELLCPNDPC